MTEYEARILLAFRRPGGGDYLPEEGTALAAYLKANPEFATEIDSADQFDAAISSTSNQIPVPATLRAKLHSQASRAISTAAWRGVARKGALLAAAMLAGVIGLSLYAINRPKLDLEGLALRHDADVELDRREQTVKTWLADHKLPTAIPVDFDFTLCSSFGYAELQGEKVPVLRFQDPRNAAGFAYLYLVPKNQFQLKGLPEQASSSFCTAMVLPSDRNVSSHVFVLVYTGDLIRFLKPNARQLG